MPVIETLYKTNVPEQMKRAEYYQTHIDAKFHGGKWVFVVTEKHGWYNDQGKEVIDPRTTLDPGGDEGFATIEEAWRRYDQQVQRRASDGFVHSFYIEFDGNALGPVHKYRHL
jgi:hypothetical protein